MGCDWAQRADTASLFVKVLMFYQVISSLLRAISLRVTGQQGQAKHNKISWAANPKQIAAALRVHRAGHHTSKTDTASQAQPE